MVMVKEDEIHIILVFTFMKIPQSTVICLTQCYQNTEKAKFLNKFRIFHVKNCNRTKEKNTLQSYGIKIHNEECWA